MMTPIEAERAFIEANVPGISAERAQALAIVFLARMNYQGLSEISRSIDRFSAVLENIAGQHKEV